MHAGADLLTAIGDVPNARQSARPPAPVVGAADDRMTELDSLRGLAAFVVLVGHLVAVYALSTNADRAVSDAGRAAVVVFFVLSGFVLSLPFHSGKRVGYGQFVIRRVFRIYPVYLASVFLALALSALVDRRTSGLSPWFEKQWADAPSRSSLASHFSLIWSFPEHHDELNGPLWSLVYEMRVSLIFPFLMLLLVVLSTKQVIILLPIVSLVGIYLGHESNQLTQNDWFGTVRVLPMFMIGILLAGSIERIRTNYEHDSLHLLGILWLPLLAVAWSAPLIYSSHAGSVIRDWSDTVVAAMLITAIVASGRVRRLMRTRVLVWLGKISYSLYLFQLVVILALVNLLHGHVPLPTILTLAAGLSILVAWIGYRIVELPSIAIGRHLSRRWRRDSVDAVEGARNSEPAVEIGQS